MPASEPVCLKDIEDAAHRALPKNALDYYKSGAEQQATLRDNRRAFQGGNSIDLGHFSGQFWGHFLGRHSLGNFAV